MAKGRPRSSLSAATPLVRTADPRPGSINAHPALCVAQGLAGVISRAARPVDSACHRGNQHRLGDRAYHVDPQWLSQRVSRGHLRCCGGDLPVRPSPMNRTASMILGHWCSEYGPFDPRSWKTPVGASPGNGRRRSGRRRAMEGGGRGRRRTGRFRETGRGGVILASRLGRSRAAGRLCPLVRPVSRRSSSPLRRRRPLGRCR